MKQISLLVIGLLTLSLNAYSAMGSRAAAMGGGAADTGGGNAVGNQLLDIYENDGAAPINVTQSRAYQEVIVPLFKNLDTKVKFLSTKIMAASAHKTWILDTKPLTDQACINQSMITVEKTIVGGKDTLVVRLYQPWYQYVPDLQNPAALIMHEFVRAHALKNGNMSDNTVKSLTRLFLNANQVSEEQLADALVASKFATNVGDEAFITATQFAATKEKLIVAYQAGCGRGERIPSWYNDILDGEFEGIRAVYNYEINLHEQIKARKMTCAALKAEVEK
jgi:hypothetical protein